MDISFTVCLCVCVCAYVCIRLRVSPLRIKIAASNFARRFTGVQGRKSRISGNFAPKKPKIGRIRVAHALADSSDRDGTFVVYRETCGRSIGMCGYTAVPLRRTYLFRFAIYGFSVLA